MRAASNKRQAVAFGLRLRLRQVYVSAGKRPDPRLPRRYAGRLGGAAMNGNKAFEIK